MENTIKTPKLTYSVVEAAEALGVSKTAMYQIIRTDGNCIGKPETDPN